MSTLQELLKLGLVAIGSDDSRFATMEAAGAALVKHLLSNPALVIPATLIAIDCDADENDPILTLVEGLLWGPLLMKLVPAREHNRKSPANMAGITKDITLVLDGQQRITSLFIGLRGSFRLFYYR